MFCWVDSGVSVFLVAGIGEEYVTITHLLAEERYILISQLVDDISYLWKDKVQLIVRGESGGIF